MATTAMVVLPWISPFRAGGNAARAAHAAEGVRFVEVFVDAPLEESEHRQQKGLYAKARAGQIIGFTGIDDPYEPPLAPELILRSDDGDATKAAAASARPPGAPGPPDQ